MPVILAFFVILVVVAAIRASVELISMLVHAIFVDYLYVTLIAVFICFVFILKSKGDAENSRKAKVESNRLERERLHLLRDSDRQSEPCKYEIGKHGNQTLAIRYGLANTDVEVIPYYYFAKGGIQKRNFDRDRRKIVDSNFIRLRKICRLNDENQFLVELTDFHKKRAIAVHCSGEEFIRTFYPINLASDGVDHDWWKRNSELELALKDNKTFTLKEMAKFHVDKIVPTRIY